MIDVGTLLDGKYRVERALGAGGFGEVYLARDIELRQRQVALKVLSTPDPERRETLLREMDALVQVHHPHVVTFHHHFEDQDRMYLVMEYCEGGSLDRRLRQKGQQKKEDVFEWCLQLCAALAALHEAGVVHHDIKPANILFSSDDVIKIGDFGLANQNGGTRIYQPPEMWLGDSVSPTDGRIDLYALGLTVLEAVTGKHPFSGLSGIDGLRRRVAHDFVPTDLPRWIQDVLLKATHPTPELRFQTAEDFAEAIQRRHVAISFDANRIKAHAFARKAEEAIGRRKYKRAATLASHALEISPDCVAALLAAGRCHLLMRRLERAAECLSLAQSINPRAPVQKELGWLRLEEGRVPSAISLLTDHLQRHADDYEAHNLLLKCFFVADRWDAGLEFASGLSSLKTNNACFQSNEVLFEILLDPTCAGAYFAPWEEDIAMTFVQHNAAVAIEDPPSWERKRPALKSKLLFQEFHYAAALRNGRPNTIAVYQEDGERVEFTRPIVSFGSLKANDIAFPVRGISRRHAVVVNLPSEVWLYDLGSAEGVTVDGTSVAGRRFLDGVHDVAIGRKRIRIAAKSDLLV